MPLAAIRGRASRCSVLNCRGGKFGSSQKYRVKVAENTVFQSPFHSSTERVVLRGIFPVSFATAKYEADKRRLLSATLRQSDLWRGGTVGMTCWS